MFVLEKFDADFFAWTGFYSFDSNNDDPDNIPNLSGSYAGGATVPDPPTLVSATPGDEQVTLTWTPPEEDGGAEITAYHVYKDGVEFEDDATSPFVVTGLTNGVEYDFTVTAENAEGESDPSNELSATPEAPADPNQLRTDANSRARHVRLQRQIHRRRAG